MSNSTEHHRSVPQLRFPEFSGDWERKRLGEVYTFKVTNSFSRENLNYEDGAVKNIHYGDIHTKFQTLFDVANENVPFINPEISIGRISEDNYCKEGDLILADASEDLNDVGKSIEIINLNNEKLLSGLHTILARPSLEKLSIGFGGYLFMSNKIRTQIQKESQGSKVLSISSTRLSKIALIFPSKAEQQKNASFFTAIDEKLQSLKKKKSLLEGYKKGVMQRLFCLHNESGKRLNRELNGLQDDTDFEDNSETAKSLNQLNLRFRQDNGSEFPDWEVKKLGEVVDIKKGEQLNKEELTENGTYPCLNGGINPSGYTEKYNSDENTITISEGGNSCGYINYMNSKFWLGGHCYKVIMTIEINKIYFYQLLKLNEQKIMNLRVGSGLPNIQQKDLRNFNLVICNSIEEQTKIANFLSALDEKIKSVQEQIEKMEVWKKGLLQKMFV